MDIKILTTGGTIDKVYFDAQSQFQIGESTINEIFNEAGVGFKSDIESVLRKDSLELDDEDRELIKSKVAACSDKRILITHGTDTMVKTASVLQGFTDKTIVLTGAMQPARLRSTDAIFNVGYAVAATQILPPGVYIAMNGKVFDADKVRKNREAQRFEDC
ncbi:Glutaminase-asparaginase [Thalassocella blandensis]|nr:Glutaminase-asparaginase [Thalassocella blandensis]